MREIYTRWVKPRANNEKQDVDYCLRDEGSWLFEGWKHDFSLSFQARIAWKIFRESLIDNLQKDFGRVEFPDRPRKVRVCVSKLREQKKFFEELSREGTIISMDSCLSGSYNIGVSRAFPVGSSAKSPRLIERPGEDDIATQIRRIPAGEYILFDDDIASGFTVSQVLSRLPLNVRIKRIVSLAHSYQGEAAENPRYIDIGDCRDFLAGSRRGGLVMELPNGRKVRAPYLEPYVLPSSRSSLPISSSKSFSRSLWVANLRFFDSLPQGLRVGDMDSHFAALMTYLGFDAETPMPEVCEWHLRNLETATESRSLPSLQQLKDENNIPASGRL